LVGDLYNVLISFEPEDDITLTEINLIVDSIEVETQVALSSAGAADALDSSNLM
jgi:hypothetical protein